MSDAEKLCGCGQPLKSDLGVCVGPFEIDGESDPDHYGICCDCHDVKYGMEERQRVRPRLVAE